MLQNHIQEKNKDVYVMYASYMINPYNLLKNNSENYI